jgi:predicted nucleic acid-binding Zn ribbon protein
MTGSAKKPLRVSEALQKYLAESGIGERIEESNVLPEWEQRVGAAIAAVTTPLRVAHGTLVVGVRSSAWLMELKLMEREIVKRLNEGRDRGRIQAIRFVMGDGAGV